MREFGWLGLGLFVAACGGKAAPSTPSSPTATMAFGDCLGPEATFVDGQRPTPPEPVEEGYGVGTAMALEEGKMGKKDSDRAEGQYRLKRPAPDEQAGLTATGDISSGFDDANVYGGLLGTGGGGLSCRNAMVGGFGFGRSGFGPGGGGSGWGTIGTGRYGTIGHGSGTGSGYGVGGGRGGMRRRSASVPTTSIGQPQSNGDLDKAIIRRYIKRNLQKIQYCYEKELISKPKLAGTVTAQFLITGTGKVGQSSASGVDPEVASCVAQVIQDIEFPAPKNNGNVQVNYPFVFHVVGDDAPAEPAPPAPPEPRKPGPNPLRGAEADLASCFARHPGAAVVTLGYDAAGAVTSATADGVDATTATCIAAAAKKVRRATPSITAERCPIAFGVRDVAEHPALDVVDGTISLAGARVVANDDAVADLSTTISKHVVSTTAGALLRQLPLVVRPTDATPMRSVYIALAAAVDSGEGFVLARRRGGAWAPLQTGKPVPPVAQGTGERWDVVTACSFSGVGVLVMPDGRVRIGATGEKKWEELPAGADLGARLRTALARRKAAGHVQIAADPSVPYATVVGVVDAATDAGFADWKLTDPDGLAVACE